MLMFRTYSALRGVNNVTYPKQWGNQNNAAFSKKITDHSHNGLKQGSGNSIVVSHFNY